MVDTKENFRQAAKRVAGTNALQALLIVVALVELQGYVRYDIPLIPVYIILSIVFIVDLYLTYKFILAFSAETGNNLRSLLIYVYLAISAVARIGTILFLFEVVVNLTVLSIVYALVGLCFGYILLQLVSGVEMIHRDKILLIAYANLSGFTIIFGDFFQLIYTGIKAFLPAFSAFTYLLLSFDYGKEILEYPKGDDTAESNELKPSKNPTVLEEVKDSVETTHTEDVELTERN